MDAVSTLRQNQILELLQELERENDITIIHAIESGSRAWGFPSSDSDYDIRFIYHHPQAWYISAFEKKDHIELEISDDLDAGGWDIGKMLRLMQKGNAAAFEWLYSPVVYRSNVQKTQLLKDLGAEIFNPAPVFYHYCSLAKKKLSDTATQTNAKYFLYALRALLCAKFVADKTVIDKATAPPVNFHVLVEEYLPANMQTQLNDVLTIKAQGGEKDTFEIPKELWMFANGLYQMLSSHKVTGDKCKDLEVFDEVFRKVVASSNISCFGE